jgi:hypothetical protein
MYVGVCPDARPIVMPQKEKPQKEKNLLLFLPVDRISRRAES